MDPPNQPQSTYPVNKSPMNLSSNQQPFLADNFYNFLSTYSPNAFNSNLPPSMMYQGNSPMMMAGMLPAQQPISSLDADGEEKKDQSNSKDKSRRKIADGRVYKCSKCDKSYLSYPALYTHTKLKHIQTGETPSITNGRMRGRPRKALVRNFCFTLIER